MKQLFTKNSQAIFFNQHPLPIQRMLDFDWLCRRDTPSIAAIVNPNRAGMHKAFFGNTEILIPVYTSIKEAAKAHPKADILVNFASMRSAYASSKEALETESINTVAITAEGIPENETRELIRIANTNKKWIIGPATVGAIKPGAFRVGNTGGSIEGVIEAKLYRPGSAAVVTVSGGMSPEIYNILARYADGVYEAIAVGGDKFPGSTLLDNVLRFEKDPNVKMHIVLGEIGGTAELEIVEALKQGKIKKPLVAWVTGTVAKQFPTEVQFGHANAKSGVDMESAQAKNKALKKAGAFVPKSFNQFGDLIKKVFSEQVANKKGYIAPEEVEYQAPPLDYKEAIRLGKVRRTTSIVSTISDDRGEDSTYNKKTITSYAKKSIGTVINALWFKGQLSKVGEEFMELCVKLTADHGPAVATAHNAIVTARAGKDVIDSLATGLLTIGPRHGGAVDGAAKWCFDGVKRKMTARDIIDEHKKSGKLIMGIGHKIKTVQNPDSRVEVLKKFAKKNMKTTPHLDFALSVEQETIKKKNNLILNVDGAIGAIFLDILSQAKFKSADIETIINIGTLNGLFALGRTIGMIGHILDQKRMSEGIYRHPWDDILYV